MFQNTKFTLYLEQKQGHVYTKMEQTFAKNKFVIEKMINKHIPVVIFFYSGIKQKYLSHIIFDYRYNLVLSLRRPEDISAEM